MEETQDPPGRGIARGRQLRQSDNPPYEELPEFAGDHEVAFLDADPARPTKALQQ
jgi:hypothetical protein